MLCTAAGAYATAIGDAGPLEAIFRILAIPTVLYLIFAWFCFTMTFNELVLLEQDHQTFLASGAHLVGRARELFILVGQSRAEADAQLQMTEQWYHNLAILLWKHGKPTYIAFHYPKGTLSLSQTCDIWRIFGATRNHAADLKGCRAAYVSLGKQRTTERAQLASQQAARQALLDAWLSQTSYARPASFSMVSPTSDSTSNSSCGSTPCTTPSTLRNLSPFSTIASTPCTTPGSEIGDPNAKVGLGEGPAWLGSGL